MSSNHPTALTINFEEMKLLARQIDQGLNMLEKKLENPFLLGLVDEEEIYDKAGSTLDKLIKEIDNINEQVLRDKEDITEDVYSLKADCENIEDFNQSIKDNIEIMEEHLKKSGYTPLEQITRDDESSSSCISPITPELESTILLANTTPILNDSIDSVTSVQVKNENHNGNETWRNAGETSLLNHEINTTFTTPCPKYKLPDISEGNSLYTGLRVPQLSSHKAIKKPTFNLDDTDRRMSIFNNTIQNNINTTSGMPFRRLSIFPSAANQLQTPPDPEVSAISRRLLCRSARKKIGL